MVQNETLRVGEKVMLWVFNELIKRLMITSKFEHTCVHLKMVNIFHLQKWLIFFNNRKLHTSVNNLKYIRPTNRSYNYITYLVWKIKKIHSSIT